MRRSVIKDYFRVCWSDYGLGPRFGCVGVLSPRADETACARRRPKRTHQEGLFGRAHGIPSLVQPIGRDPGIEQGQRAPLSDRTAGTKIPPEREEKGRRRTPAPFLQFAQQA